MRICFLVSDVKLQQATYGGIYLAWAAHKRGHDVRFVSVDDLSFLDDNSVMAATLRVRAGEYPRPVDYLKALVSEEAVREEDALSGFDVVFLRYNPLREGVGRPTSPVIDFCWRLRLGGTLQRRRTHGWLMRHWRMRSSMSRISKLHGWALWAPTSPGNFSPTR